MLLRSNFSSFPHYYIYIFLTFLRQITYSFVKCGCSVYCFPHSLKSDMSKYEVRISRSVSVSPLEFEITRVNCTVFTGICIYQFFSKFSLTLNGGKFLSP